MENSFKSLLLLCSLVLHGCNMADNQPLEAERPGACSKEISSASCLARWNWTLLFKQIPFPHNISLKIKGKTIFNECSGDPSPAKVTRFAGYTSVEIGSFNRIDPKDVIDIEVRDLFSNCLGSKLYYQNFNQPFTIKKIDSKDHVWIEI